MTEQSVHQLAQILALQAEILGMQAENMQRATLGMSMAFTNEDFCSIARSIREVVEQ